MKITILITLLLASGGVSLAAEQSLPGDMLYPVKLEVNERVKGWFAFGALADAELQARLLQERLSEAEALLAAGTYEGDVAVKANTALSTQLAKTQNLANEVSVSTDAETQAKVRTALSTALADFRTKLEAFKLTIDSKKTKGEGSGGGSSTADVALSAGLDDLIDQTDEVIADVETDESENEDGSMFEDTSEESTSTTDEGEMENEESTTTIDSETEGGSSVDLEQTNIEASTTVETNI